MKNYLYGAGAVAVALAMGAMPAAAFAQDGNGEGQDGVRATAQVQGQPWGKPGKDEPGAIEYSADLKKPRTHRVRNEGKTEYHVIAVQLLP